MIDNSTESSAQHVKASVIISVDPNQSQPEYEQGSTKPSVSEVRLILTQPVTTDLSDMELLIARRDDILDVLGPLNGEIVGAMTPIPRTGRSYGKSYSPAYE